MSARGPARPGRRPRGLAGTSAGHRDRILTNLQRAAVLLVASTALAACSSADDDEEEQSPTAVTTAPAATQRVEVTDTSVGRVVMRATPQVAAETQGRVAEVLVDVGDRVSRDQTLLELDETVQSYRLRSARAQKDRLEALIDNQERTVSRLEDLRARDSASQSQLDGAKAELASLRAQLRETRARLDEAQHALDKTTVESPIAGLVDERMVSEGDFVTPGTPLVRLVNEDRIRVFLPFPETIADRLQTGLPVRLWRPGAPDRVVEATISEIRPTVGARSHSVEAVVHAENPGGWRSGASVIGEIVLEQRDDAVVVPRESVVQRPAGEVVYVIEDGKARQRVVEAGVERDGRVELRSGVAAGATVAVDGAGFLTDAAPVTVRDGGE